MNNKNWTPVITNDDWKLIEENLDIINPIRLKIDGYNVKIHLTHIKMRLIIVPFINGYYNPDKWELENKEILEKFFQPKEAWIHRKKFRDDFVKIYGKRNAKKKGVFDKYKYIQYYWESFRSMKLHYKKKCKQILVHKHDLNTEFILNYFKSLTEVD